MTFLRRLIGAAMLDAGVLALLAWASWALLTLQAGARILPTKETVLSLLFAPPVS